jgi:hypothetical protein
MGVLGGGICWGREVATSRDVKFPGACNGYICPHSKGTVLYVAVVGQQQYVGVAQ